jgi:hypothetical protein
MVSLPLLTHSIEHLLGIICGCVQVAPITHGRGQLLAWPWPVARAVELLWPPRVAGEARVVELPWWRGGAPMVARWSSDGSRIVPSSTDREVTAGGRAGGIFWRWGEEEEQTRRIFWRGWRKSMDAAWWWRSSACQLAGGVEERRSSVAVEELSSPASQRRGGRARIWCGGGGAELASQPAAWRTMAEEAGRRRSRAYRAWRTSVEEAGQWPRSERGGACSRAVRRSIR